MSTRARHAPWFHEGRYEAECEAAGGRPSMGSGEIELRVNLGTATLPRYVRVMSNGRAIARIQVA